MIHSFYLENFLSINGKQSISFETARKDKTLLDLVSVEVSPNLFINKLGIFFGANASGKSNFLFAMETIFMLMYAPQHDKENFVLRYHPFALNDGKPINMGVVFYVNGIRYDYEISYCKTHIITEKLYYYPLGVKAVFYTRDFVGQDMQPKITFGGTVGIFANSSNTIKGNTLNNHTVLSTIAKVSLKEDAFKIVDLYNWVKSKVHNINGDNVGVSMINEIEKVCSNNPIKNFYLQLLNKADFNITDIAVVDKKNIPAQLIDAVKESNLSDEDKSKMLKDVAFTNHSDYGDFVVMSAFQSDGTKRFAELLGYLYELVSDNHIYFFDELGNRLHYDLMVYYIALMLYNSNHSQLFFSTHNILLLDEEFVRRDMVYLVEKDKATASSICTRVSDMGLHKNLSMFNAYRIGRLGAKPEVGSPYLNLSGC